MDIRNMRFYKDGGTVEVEITDDLSYYKDNRISSATKGKWFVGYPSNGCMVEDLDMIKEIESAADEFLDKKFPPPDSGEGPEDLD